MLAEEGATLCPREGRACTEGRELTPIPSPLLCFLRKGFQGESDEIQGHCSAGSSALHAAAWAACRTQCRGPRTSSPAQVPAASGLPPPVPSSPRRAVGLGLPAAPGGERAGGGSHCVWASCREGRGSASQDPPPPALGLQ